jgi:nucleotide-binding universal stress UspA family protein
MRILIGYDGSTASDHALAGLSHAGLPSRADALVATVTTPWPDAGPEAWAGAQFGISAGEILESATKEARMLAGRAARRVKLGFPGWKVDAESIVAPPAEGLLRKADAWEPDLLVVGSHGRTAVSRLVLGSVSTRVLHHAKADVLISRMRAGRRKSAAIRVLLCMDGSAGSHRALEAVLARPWPKGTRVRVLAVVDWRELPGAMLKPERIPHPEKARRMMQTWIEARVEAASRRLGRKELTANHDVLLGDPRRVILKVSRDWKADCIFLGSRGLNAVDRFLLGSVSSAVAARAPCSVEVVRTAHGADGGTPA